MTIRLYDFFVIISVIYVIVGYFCLTYELFRLLCLIVIALQLTVFLYCYEVDLKEVFAND